MSAHLEDVVLREVRDGVVRTAVWSMSDISAALHTAGFVIEQGWQPIATAPRDGTPVLLIARYPTDVAWSDQYHSWWHHTARRSRVVTEDGHWARWPHSFPPTHYRPLPIPPEGQP